MAEGHEPVSKKSLPARVAAAFLAAAILPAFAALAMQGAGGGHAPDWDYVARAARFTLVQASLSTLLAVGLAVPVALALSRRAFTGRGMLLRLFAIPQSLPPLVAVLGLLALAGRNGIIPGMPSIYGLAGILIAHVFFNLPFAVRLMLSALERVPGESWRLAAQLGMRSSDIFRLIEWPVIARALPGIAGLIFMLCVTSFTIILTLGGGPKAATLEVAIYQALRFDFEPRLALALSLAQLMLCAGLMALLNRFTPPVAANPITGFAIERPRSAPGWDSFVIGLAGLFVAAPMAAVVASGLKADLAGLLANGRVWQAIITSTLVAAAAGTLALALAFPMARMAARGSRGYELLTQMSLLVPPIVLGAGWFLLARGAGDGLSPFFVILGNALLALPFAARALLVPMRETLSRDDRLCAELGLAGLARLRLIDWPQLRRPAALAFLLAAMVSFGDLGIIAFFGAEDFITLPYLLYLQLGSYRTADAEGLALTLMVLALGLAMATDRLAERKP